MNLELMKQLRYEYAEQQHIISIERLHKLYMALCDNKETITHSQNDPQPSNTFESYAQMTRQQRRAYERRLAKENKRKH